MLLIVKGTVLQLSSARSEAKNQGSALFGVPKRPLREVFECLFVGPRWPVYGNRAAAVHGIATVVGTYITEKERHCVRRGRTVRRRRAIEARVTIWPMRVLRSSKTSTAASLRVFRSW